MGEKINRERMQGNSKQKHLANDSSESPEDTAFDYVSASSTNILNIKIRSQPIRNYLAASLLLILLQLYSSFSRCRPAKLMFIIVGVPLPKVQLHLKSFLNGDGP